MKLTQKQKDFIIDESEINEENGHLDTHDGKLFIDFFKNLVNNPPLNSPKAPGQPSELLSEEFEALEGSLYFYMELLDRAVEALNSIKIHVLDNNESAKMMKFDEFKEKLKK